MSKVTKDCLRKTLKYLEEHPWGQGLYYRYSEDTYEGKYYPAGAVCLMGAFGAACCDWDWAKHNGRTPEMHTITCWEERTLFAYALGFLTENALYEWNDAAGRTKDKVMERIEAALENPAIPED